MSEVEKKLILMGLSKIQQACEGVDEDYLRGMTDGLMEDAIEGFDSMKVYPSYARGLLDGLELRLITLPEAGL